MSPSVFLRRDAGEVALDLDVMQAAIHEEERLLTEIFDAARLQQSDMGIGAIWNLLTVVARK